eukprot:4546151-Amphidinium_carterae.1
MIFNVTCANSFETSKASVTPSTLDSKSGDEGVLKSESQLIVLCCVSLEKLAPTGAWHNSTSNLKPQTQPPASAAPCARRPECLSASLLDPRVELMAMPAHAKMHMADLQLGGASFGSCGDI